MGKALKALKNKRRRIIEEMNELNQFTKQNCSGLITIEPKGLIAALTSLGPRSGFGQYN